MTGETKGLRQKPRRAWQSRLCHVPSYRDPAPGLLRPCARDGRLRLLRAELFHRVSCVARLASLAAGVVLMVAIVGFAIPVWWFVWSLIRTVKGGLLLMDNKPIANLPAVRIVTARNHCVGRACGAERPRNAGRREIEGSLFASARLVGRGRSRHRRRARLQPSGAGFAEFGDCFDDRIGDVTAIGGIVGLLLILGIGNDGTLEQHRRRRRLLQ